MVDKHLDYWLGELANKSKNTRHLYLQFFNQFCIWLGKSPSEIVKERNETFRSENRITRRTYEVKLNEYLSFLKDQGYSASTRRLQYSSVKSFFYYVTEPLKMKSSDLPRGEANGQRTPTKDEIKQYIYKLPLRLRALVFFLKDSGLRIGGVVKLTYGDVKEGLESGDYIITVSPINHITTEKRGVIAYPFIGDESIDLIKQYIERRKKGTRKIEPEEITDSSPLFCQSSPGKFLTSGGICSLLSTHAKSRGLNKISAHSLRKFCRTRLASGGVPESFIDKIIGQKTSQVRDVYTNPTVQQLKDAYAKAYDELRVFDKLVPIQQIKPVKIEVETLKQENVSLRETIDLLKAGMSVMNEKLEEEKKWRKKVEEVLESKVRVIEMGHRDKFPIKEMTRRQELGLDKE